MRFRPLPASAPPNMHGAIFRDRRVKAGRFVADVARALRIRRRDLHAFEDGRSTLPDDDLARLYRAVSHG